MRPTGEEERYGGRPPRDRPRGTPPALEQMPVPYEGPACPTDPAAVDADVAGAVGRALDMALQERLDECERLDHTFTRDVAERVSRFTLRGGKRMRSQLLWWGLRAGGDTTHAPAALRIAAGLELVQTCALVHDDVMDGSPTRRGEPALHASFAADPGVAADSSARESFGRAAAILAGDLALAWADDIVAELALPPDRRTRVLAIWRAMRTEMIAGQYLDLHGQASASRSTVQAIRVARLKSALYSVERPLALGAALSGADGALTRALRSAGRCAGIAFQLRDDLLGVFGDPRQTGKPSGEDLREGKATYLVAVAHARAMADQDRTAVRVLEHALGRADLAEADLARVRSVLVSTGAKEAVESKITWLMAHSARHLEAAVMDPGTRSRLRVLLFALAGVAVHAGMGAGFLRTESGSTCHPSRARVPSVDGGSL